MSETVHCPKCDEAREFPPRKSVLYYLLTAGIIGGFFKPFFRRCESCGFPYAEALAAAKRKVGGERR